jgi:flagellar protein FlaI
MNIGRKIMKRFVKGYKILSTRPPPTYPPIPVKPVGPVEAREIPPERKEVIEKIEGFEIPGIPTRRIEIGKLEIEERKPLSLTYPLIPKEPKKDETVFAFAKIFWDSKLNKNFYKVVEPELSGKLEQILIKIKRLLEQRLNIDLSKMKKTEASEYLNKQIEELINYFGFKINLTEKEILRYYVERDFIGLGKLEPLFRDPQIEDISCDGVGIPIFIFHRNPEISSIVTNVTFDSPDELDSFIIRLSQLSGKSISVAQPLVDATLPDGSRLQATLATDIARRGSNFTIRKFTEKPLTPTDLMNYGTIDIKSMAFL